MSDDSRSSEVSSRCSGRAVEAALPGMTRCIATPVLRLVNTTLASRYSRPPTPPIPNASSASPQSHRHYPPLPGSARPRSVKDRRLHINIEYSFRCVRNVTWRIGFAYALTSYRSSATIGRTDATRDTVPTRREDLGARWNARGGAAAAYNINCSYHSANALALCQPCRCLSGPPSP